MKGRRGLVVAFGIYAMAALALFGHRRLLEGINYVGDGTKDPSLFIWIFHFLPAAIAHFQNPFVLKAAWAPYGLNIMQAVTSPLLAIIAWPITAFFGPFVAFNIVLIATPALAATSGFVFATSYARSWATAFAAGWVFGFSTAVFAPMLGHVEAAFIAFLPLAFLAVKQRAEGNLSFRKFFILLTVVLIAQFLVALEDFVTEIIFLVPFALVIEAVRPGGINRLTRLRTNNPILGLIAAYAAVGVAMSPFIYYFFRDYAQIPHLLQNGYAYGIDILNFVIPTPVTWLGGNLSLPVARQYTGNYSEDLGYIGAPLLLLVMVSVWRLRHEKQAWPLLAVLGLSFVFVLGPRLHILGRLTIFLPWALIDKLPLLGNALPSRMMPFVLLAMSGIFAMWVDQYIERRRGAALAALTVAAACVLPPTPIHRNWWNAPIPTAQLFSSGAYRHLIRPGETVLFLPFHYAGDDETFWQTETQGYFRMANGYGDFIPNALEAWPAVKILGTDAPSFDFSKQFDLFARANGIGKVIVPVSILPVWDAALKSGGWHPQIAGDLAVYAESAQARDATPQISSTEAGYTFEAAHLAALGKAASCMIAKGSSHLDIPSAIAAHCVSADIRPVNNDPNQNWDSLGGWLGFIGADVGLGVTTDAVTAGHIVAATGADATRIFFPFPKQFHPGISPYETGQLLEIFPRQAVIETK